QVLINGAGGSAGSFAIQLAKRAGAVVTGVDGPHQLDFMRSLGVDHVIDYTREEFTTSGKQYDLILDMIAHRSVFSLPQALRPNGVYYVTGGAVGVLLQTLVFGGLIKRTQGKHVRMLIVPQSRADSIAMSELCAAGEITPMIDREFPLQEVPDAMRYIAAGRAKGKVVITIV
ncbi:MAG: NAD(P)-dependent alcohol dehydrogenase, partial [Caldilineaceae bacterium]|nr:NAD(P)-dependent alcohol dehydrogenase [Caldilineaceae bacterium]